MDPYADNPFFALDTPAAPDLTVADATRTLHPCRDCGSAGHVIRWPHWMPPYAVRCGSCGRQSADAETPALAALRWNAEGS